MPDCFDGFGERVVEYPCHLRGCEVWASVQALGSRGANSGAQFFTARLWPTSPGWLFLGSCRALPGATPV